MDVPSPGTASPNAPALTPIAQPPDIKQPASDTPVTSIATLFGLEQIENARRTLIDLLPQAVFFKDSNSVLVYVNPAMANEFRRKPEEIIGKTDADFFPPHMAAKYRTDDLRVMTEKKTERIEEVFISGGRRRIVEVTKAPVINPQGEVIGLVGIFSDVTQYRQAYEALQKSEAELRRVWDDSLDGMRITDENGLTVRVNRAFCEMVKKTAEELVGKPFSVTYDTPFPESILAKHKKRFQERAVEPLSERELLLWTGEKVWFELSNSFLESPGQRPQLLSIFRDVSDRKQAEEKLRDFAARLERSNRELQDFAYVASHDLQEPLRKVSVFGDRLKAKFGDKLGDEGCDYLDRMQKAGTRMQALITDLLTFSRVTSKSQPFVQVDLNKVVREVTVDLEARIEQVGARVNVSELPTVEAEPLHMRQLMQNLIGNALKFQRPDTKPVVTVDAFIFKEFAPDGQESAREMMQLTVSDNGIGFDEKYLDRIFQVFQRLHNRTEYEGTGMGLAITRKIVEHHKGQITAKSKPGEGATFIVILPVQQSMFETKV
jgi:two-component system, LuxR family, sensor kinase FixL